MKYKFQLLLPIMMLFMFMDLNAQVVKKWACIGNSITYGARLKMRSTESYPALLQKKMGDGYQVKNFGLSGRTMTTSGRGYLKETGWKKVLQFKPDVVTIALGTNDSKEDYWHGEEEFVISAQQMIDALKSLSSRPQIFVLLPPKSYPNSYGVRNDFCQKTIVPLLKKVAKKNGLEMIDLYPVLVGDEEYFADHLHPNAAGQQKLANFIYKKLRKKLRK